MFDTIIIGSGPAGLSAALTLKQLNKNILWLGKKDLSFKINSAEKIRNYPGLIEVSGKEMRDVFLEQIKRMNLEIVDKQVTGVYPQTGKISVLCGSEAFEAKTIILAVGVETVKPIAGELENVGQGVSYCATCDGFLYKGKEIFVYATNKNYEHEAKYLATLAAKVYYCPIYKDIDINMANVEIINARPKEIKRNGLRKKDIVLSDDRTITVDGIFMLKDAVSPSVLVPGIETDNNHIKGDRQCKTNYDGIFAAGDCTGRPYQYTKAVGEGNVCAHSVVAYLNQNK